MGLMMHAKARSMIELGSYLEALEVLGMAEVCKPTQALGTKRYPKLNLNIS